MQKAFRLWCGTCPWKFVTNWRTSCEKGRRGNKQSLKEVVIPFFETNYKKNCVLQEDNARPYTSKSTNNCLMMKKILWNDHHIVRIFH